MGDGWGDVTLLLWDIHVPTGLDPSALSLPGQSRRGNAEMAIVNGNACEEIEIRVPCKPEYVRTIRKAVADFAVTMKLPECDIEALEIAISEAASNVVRHAYVGCEQAEPLRVKCSHDDGGLTVEVVDRGRGFNAPPDGVVPEVDLNREGGLGIILIKELMDRVYYVSKPNRGTRIKMLKRTRESPSGRAKRKALGVG